MKAEDHHATLSATTAPPPSSEQANVLSRRVQALRMPVPSHEPSRGAWFPWLLSGILGLSTVWLAYLVWTSPSNSQERMSAGDPQKSAISSDSKASGEAGKQALATSTGGSDKEPVVVLESKGYIIAAHQILVSPKVSGMVTKLMIEEGNRVRKGDILAEIEDIDYRTDYDRYLADRELARQRLLELEHGNRPEEISQTKAQLQEAEAQLSTLEADWKRIQDLRRIKAATPADYDAARSKYYAMLRQVERLRSAHSLMEAGPRKERIDQARAELQTAESNVEKAKWKLDNCTIRSPITGTILKKNAEEGNLVNAIAFSGSVSLCELADLSDLEVDLTVQERDIARVFKGQQCKIRAEAFPERVYEGTVSRLMPIADRAKGAIPVRVKLRVPRDEEGVYLKPEMGAIVTFYGEAGAGKSKPPVAVLPEPRT